MSSSSSLSWSCRAASTYIPDPLSLLLPVVHRLWQVQGYILYSHISAVCMFVLVYCWQRRLLRSVLHCMYVRAGVLQPEEITSKCIALYVCSCWCIAAGGDYFEVYCTVCMFVLVHCSRRRLLRSVLHCMYVRAGVLQPEGITSKCIALYVCPCWCIAAGGDYFEVYCTVCMFVLVYCSRRRLLRSVLHCMYVRAGVLQPEEITSKCIALYVCSCWCIAAGGDYFEVYCTVCMFVLVYCSRRRLLRSVLHCMYVRAGVLQPEEITSKCIALYVCSCWCIAAGGDYFEVYCTVCMFVLVYCSRRRLLHVCTIKVSIRKKSGNLSYAPCISTPLDEQEVIQGQVLKWCFTGFRHSVFILLVAIPRLSSQVCPSIYSQLERE